MQIRIIIIKSSQNLLIKQGAFSWHTLTSSSKQSAHVQENLELLHHAHYGCDACWLFCHWQSGQWLLL